MIPLTLEAIRSSISSTYKVDPDASESVHYDEFKDTRRIYGKNLLKMTPAVARALIGKTVYALQGQNWLDVKYRAASIQDRMEKIA